MAASPSILDRGIAYLEDERRPLSLAVLTFLAAVTLRNLLEFLVVSNAPPVIWDNLVYFSLFYANVGLAVVLLLHLLTRERPARVARAVSGAFILVATVPVLDALFQLFHRYEIRYTYFIPERTSSLLKNYLLFFGDHAGAPPGMRIEIAAAMALGAAYTYAKTRSVRRAAFAAFLLYSLIYFCFGAILFFFLWVERLGGLPKDTSPRLLIDAYVLCATALVLVLGFLEAPAAGRALLKDFRLPRVLHYELMALVGLLLALREGPGLALGLPAIVECLLAATALACACTFSAMTNNMTDLEIDAVSNPGRPTVTGVIDARDYRRTSLLFLTLALSCALAAGSMSAFLVGAFVGIYALYSLPPLRLKRVPLLSKEMIALNCLVALLLGYTLGGGRELSTFPRAIILFVMVFVAACLNFIDIKDYEGDRRAGIATLPVLLGRASSQRLIGGFFFAAYAAFPFIVGPRTFLPQSLAFGALAAVAVGTRRYREGAVFAVYFASSAAYLLHVIRA